MDVARMGRGADQDAINTTFYRQVHVSRADASYPLRLAPEFEVNHAVIQRTAATLRIEHLNLIEYHVGPVGLCAFGILDGSQFQLSGLACSLKPVAAPIGRDSL